MNEQDCIVLNACTETTSLLKPPTIQLFKRGQVRLSVGAVVELGLKTGDKIEFMLPKSTSNTIYFRKSDKGFKMVSEITKGNLTRLLLCSRPLVRKLMAFFQIEDSNTYDVSCEQLDFNGSKCWFIGKEKIHKPIKWRTRTYQ